VSSFCYLQGYSEWFLLPCNIFSWNQFCWFVPYSARLAFNSLMEGDTDKENESKVVVSQVHQIQHLIVLQMEQS
jgi:hypothetical protein